jgi:dihydroflavonol-4-reductase
MSQGLPENLRPLSASIEFFKLDLADPKDILAAFSGQDLVIHMAAMIRARTPQERMLQKTVNVEGTLRTIEACRGARVPRLVHVSTVAAIGISADLERPADEAFRFNLDRLGLSYNSTKQRAEQLVLDANGPDLQTTVANPGVVFGGSINGYRGAVIIEHVLRNRVAICTAGGLSVVHVDDVADGIQQIAEKGRSGQRYILTSENLSFSEIAETICRRAGIHRRLIRVPNFVRDFAGFLINPIERVLGGDPSLHLDRRYAHQFYTSKKARIELGFDPRSFARIVEDYLNYARRSGVPIVCPPDLAR